MYGTIIILAIHHFHLNLLYFKRWMQTRSGGGYRESRARGDCRSFARFLCDGGFSCSRELLEHNHPEKVASAYYLTN